ncbi:MAG: hypothetical protein P8077_02190 [Gammaproteobacteria bacterium]
MLCTQRVRTQPVHAVGIVMMIVFQLLCSGCDVLSDLASGQESFVGIEPATTSDASDALSDDITLETEALLSPDLLSTEPLLPEPLSSEPLLSEQEVLPPAADSVSQTAFETTVYPFLSSHCATCHSSTEAGMLPFHADLNVTVAYRAVRSMVVLSDPEQSRMVMRLRVDRHNCPETMSCAQAADTLSQLIGEWAAVMGITRSEQPGLVDPVSMADVIAAIEADRAALTSEQLERVQYISLHEAYNEGASERELDVYRVGVSKTLNLISRYASDIVNPTAIDERSLIYRINVDDYWSQNQADAQSVWARIQAGPQEGLNQGVKEDYIEACQLGYAASRPRVYNAVMELPFFASQLESELKVDKSNGVDSFKFFTIGNEVSINENDRSVWLARTEDNRQYWRSFDAFSFLNPALFTDPILEFNPDLSAPRRVVGSAAEIIFELPNGLDGYYIAGAANQKREDAFTFVVCDPERGGPCFDRESGQEELRLINGASCIDCHEDGMKFMYDELTPMIAEGTDIFTEAERARIAELYPGQTFLDAALREGRERFQSAMTTMIDAMAVSPAEYVRIDEPVNALARCAMTRYDYPMSTSN